MKGLQKKIDELSVVTLQATAAAASAAKSATSAAKSVMQNSAGSSTSTALMTVAAGMVLNQKGASLPVMTYQLFQIVSNIAFTAWFVLSFNDLQ